MYRHPRPTPESGSPGAEGGARPSASPFAAPTPTPPDPPGFHRDPRHSGGRRQRPAPADPGFRRRGRHAALVLATLLGAACAGPGGTQGGLEGPIPVVTTVGMITDAAMRIGGERVRVTGLMGPGVDPHLYRATAGDVRSLAEARLVLFGGLHLEAAMGDVLEEMGGRTRTVAVAERIPADRLLAASPDYPGQFDPHVWFDVELWTGAVRAVADALVELDPQGEAHYRERAAAYLQELDELHRWVGEQIQGLPPERRILVTAHDAFHYFGRAYGVEVRGLQGISTVVEPGAAEVQELARFLVERQVPAIFVESSVPRRTLEAVTAAVRAQGGSVVIGGELFSDAMGPEGTPEGTYVGMVRHNVRTLVEALAPEPLVP